MFHSLDGLTAQEGVAANTREFTGDGTPYLKVPGLKGLEAIRIGKHPLPLAETREYPVDSTLKRLRTEETPLVKVERAEDGTPVLLRNLLSNDGIWQKGAKVYVTGEWEDGDAKAKATARSGAAKA